MAAGKKLFLSQLVHDLTFCIFFLTEEGGREYVQVRGGLDYAGCFSEAVGNVDGVNGRKSDRVTVFIKT